LIKHYIDHCPNDSKKGRLSIKGAFDIKKGPDGNPFMMAYGRHPIVEGNVILALRTVLD
jgi:hypothetical protein